MKSSLKIFLGWFMILTLTGSLFAGPKLFKSTEMSGGFLLQTFGFAGDWRVTEIAIPYTAAMTMSDALFIDVAATPAVGIASTSKSLIGLTNTKIRVSYILKEMAILTLGVKVPTGTNKYDGDQLSTMSKLSKKAFGFPVSDFYHTMYINATASGGYAFKDLGPGDLSVGLGIGFLIKGSYALTDNASYNPGNQFNLSIATEYKFRAMQRSITAMVDGGYTNYGSDKIDDKEVFALGSKKNWAVNLVTDLTPKLPFSLKLSNYWTSAANRVGLDGNLDESGKSTVNSDLYLTTTMGLPLLAKLAPYGQLSFVFLGADDNNANNGNVIGLGGGGKKRLSEHMFLDFSANFYIGNLEDSGINGLEVTSKINYRF